MHQEISRMPVLDDDDDVRLDMLCCQVQEVATLRDTWISE